MPKPRARVVQISDLHFGHRQPSAELRQALIDVVAAAKPHVLLVTGDVANHPLPWQMNRVARYLEELRAACDLPPMMVIPGNHDYKLWGNVGFRRLTRVPFHVYFRHDGLKLSWTKRLGLYTRLGLNALWPWGRQLRDDTLAELDEDARGLVIVGFNSNALAEMMAAGKVSDSNLRAFERLVHERHDQRAFREAFKIAVVHHHPAPIAFAPTGAKERVQESFMVLYNAGTFLYQLNKAGFQLVLHGHKHFAGVCRVGHEVEIEGEQPRQVVVAAAGSASHPHPDDRRGNHINIIEIFDDDTATLRSCFFSTSSLDKPDSQTIRVAGLDAVAQRRSEARIHQCGFAVDAVEKTVRIDEAGFSEIAVQYRGCHVMAPMTVDGEQLDLQMPEGSYVRDVSVIEGPDMPAHLSLRPNPEGCDLRRYRGRIDLGHVYTAEEPPFSFGYRYRHLRGHTLSAEELDARGAEQPETEDGQGSDHEAAADANHPRERTGVEYSSALCRTGCRTLKLEVLFPNGFDMRQVKPSLEVLYKPLRSDSDTNPIDSLAVHPTETQRRAKQLRTTSRGLSMTCPDPVPDFVYRIQWSYRDGEPPPIKHEHVATVRAGQRRLLALARDHDDTARALRDEITARANELGCHTGAVLADLGMPNVRDGNEPLDVSLMVYDEESRRLRFVAATWGGGESLASEAFRPGEGVAGFAYEKSRALLHHPPSDGIGYFIRPEERGPSSALIPQTIMLSLPWFYPNPGVADLCAVVGVVNIGSRQIDSGMVQLIDAPSETASIALGQLMEWTADVGSGILDRVKDGPSSP